MSLTDQLTGADSSDGKSTVSGSVTEVGNARVEVDQRFPASSTNTLVTFAFTVANVQAVYLLSDADMTLKTNSSGSPQDTINLKAGNPLVWSKSAGYYTVPFAGNVTALYVTTTPANRLRARILTS